MKKPNKPICFLICFVMLSAIHFPGFSETYSIPDLPAAGPMLNTDLENESVSVPGTFTL